MTTLLTFLPFLIMLGQIFLLSYTVSRFQPLHLVLDLLPDNLVFNLFRLLLTCSKCLGLWVGVFISGDIYTAMIASLIMTVFEKTIGAWIDQVRLN